MGQVPIVSGSEVSSPSSGVRIDPTSFRNAALSKGRLAEGIENVGAVFGEVSAKIQEARNAKAVFDADHSLNATKNQFLNDLSKNPELAKDPGTWVPEYTTRIKATTDQIMSQPNLGPSAKRHLSMMTQNFTQHSSLEINTAALAREAADTKTSGIMSAQDDIENDAKDSYVAKMQAMNEAGVMGPKETAARIAKFDENSAEFKVNTAIVTDPIGAPAFIKSLSGVMNARKLRGVLHVAEEEQRRAQIANSQQIAASIDDDPLHTYDETQLKNKRDANLITATDYEHLHSRMKTYAATEARDQAKAEREDFDAVMLDARDNDWVTDPAPQKTAAALKAVGLGFKNQALRARLNDKVDHLMETAKRAGVKDENPVQQEMERLMNEDRNHQGTFIPMASKTTTHYFRPNETEMVHYAGGLTDLRDMTDKEVVKQFGKDATKQGVLADEQRNYIKKRTMMDDWFKAEAKAGRKPTMEDADKYRQKIEYPDVQAAVVHSLTKQDPNAAARQWLKENPNHPRASEVRKKLGP